MKSWTVEITGLRQVFNALDEWDSEAGKRLNKMITKAGKDVATNASYISPGRNPLSNWGPWTEAKRGRDLSFEPSTVARGFKVRRNNYRRRGVSAGIAWEVYQNNPAGAIYELLGSGSNVSTSQGDHLVQTINQRFRRTQPRTLLPAYYSVMTPDLQDEIRNAILLEARKAGLV